MFNTMKPQKISKSDYMLYLKHPAFIWLKKYDKEKLPEIDENIQAIFDSGHECEKYAEERFGEVCKVGFANFKEYETINERTKKALKSDVEAVSQGGFEYNNLTCIVDVLEKCDDKMYNLYEIKSGTKVKKDYLYDLAFQKYVLEGCGIKIKNIFVIHVNNLYTRQGDIDSYKLTSCQKVTNEVAEFADFTIDSIKNAKEMVGRGKLNQPSFSPSLVGCIGSLKDAIDVYRKIQGLPAYSIYDLATPGAKRIALLEDANYKLISDIPDDFPYLTTKQQYQINATKTGATQTRNDKIEEFVNKLKYPLYFLDYETFGELIPPFDGIRPYQSVPFQYSLHIQNEENGEVIHKEYIHKENSNPAEQLTKRLLEDIGADNGNVIVWYQTFETTRNKELANMFPQYADRLQDINSRVVDLMIPFKNDWVINKDFLGSASIKKVLPAVCNNSEFDYSAMQIGDGQTAQRVWSEVFIKNFAQKTEKEKEKVVKDLIDYCKLDTFAMVKILEYLKNLV